MKTGAEHRIQIISRIAGIESKQALLAALKHAAASLQRDIAEEKRRAQSTPERGA